MDVPSLVEWRHSQGAGGNPSLVSGDWCGPALIVWAAQLLGSLHNCIQPAYWFIVVETWLFALMMRVIFDMLLIRIQSKILEYLWC